MPELTPKLGIKKPLGNETVSRAAFNENYDIIDAQAQKNIAQGATAPASPAEGDLWIDTSTSPNALKRYSAGNWVKIGAVTPGDIGAVANAGNAPSIQAGTDASKPAAGTAGRLYVATDTQIVYRDTGSAWVKVGVVKWGDIDGKPATFPPSAHSHPGSDITSKVASASAADTVPWSGVSEKPSSFPPSAHKDTHKTGGADQLTPADIGAADIGKFDPTTGHKHTGATGEGPLLSTYPPFGDGRDGVFNSTGDVTLTVDVDDGDPVIKQYTSFTLNAGHVLTVSRRCKGLWILCQGDVVINGTINMNGKAANVAKESDVHPHVVVIPPIGYASIGPGGNGGNGGAGGYANDSINAAGGAGGSGGIGTWWGGAPGGGGGGGGAHTYTGSNYYAKGGSGGSFITGHSGAAGAAGVQISTTGSINGGAGSYGSGGSGGATSNGSGTATSGAGGSSVNGAGAGGGGGCGCRDASATASNGSAGQGFGGGLVVIIARGSVSIGSGGLITANGANGGAGGNGAQTSNWASGGGGGGGGGAGGGCVAIFYGTTYTNNGSITVNGGSGGPGGVKAQGSSDGTSTNGAAGANGQAGTIKIQKVVV